MACQALAAALTLATLALATTAEAATPARCSTRGLYRAEGGCKPCVSRNSPYTKNYGGVLCYTPTTLSARSTFCSNLVLPAFVRDERTKQTTRSCIPPSQTTVNLYLVTKSSKAPFLNASSYIRASLRLAGQIPPKKTSDGQVFYVKDGINNRQLIQFQDKFGVLRSRRGQTVQLTGVLVRGSGTLPFCFISYLKVCA